MFTDLASKGFCIPPELSDEMSGEGATEFCDMEEAGLGEGEGVKNVSDQIEDEDQLDEAKRPEDHNKEDPDNQPDVKSEENAIEMSEDFDAKAQDLEDVDKEKDNEDDDGGDEEEIDKQMGEVDDMDNDKLDEQMWGSDEEDNGDEEEKEEESGPGDGKQSEPELVAKDDNADKSENDKDREQGNKDETEEEENDDKQKQNNLDNLDQDNYDDDQVDPYHGKQEEQQAPDDFDLPDDLNLDDDNDDGGKDDEKEMEEKGQEKEDDTALPPEDTPDNAEDEQKVETEDKHEQETGEDGEDKGEETNEEEKTNDGTDTADNDERQEQDGEDDPGFTPQDESAVDAEENEKQNEADDKTPSVEHYGKTSHDATENVEQSETAKDTAGETPENEQQEVDGSGQASADQVEGHQGQKSTRVADASSSGKRKQQERQPGKSDSERSLGSSDQKYKKLKTTDSTLDKQEGTEDNQESEEQNKSDLYEHVKDSKSHHDAQTLDVATAEQQEEQGQITHENEEDNSDVDGDEEMAEDEKDTEDTGRLDDLLSTKLKKKSRTEAERDGEESEDKCEADGEIHELPGERILTDTVARGSDSTIHTAMEHLYLDSNIFDLESLRSELENQLGSWTQSNLPADTDAESAASELWHRYEALTSSLAQDLCEQLRLVLEPSQATKLKGDYRTGKRLNMRKVIPYIASQFRKDKIWLRRTKPSKRQYQIMLAIDDSSSMVDNHSKQMAFESLALISNALTLLESGQLSICSFGETMNVLHPFTEQFTSLSGAHLLQYLTFEQKKTKIAHLLKLATAMMIDARNKQQGIVGNPETSQLLLIVSDGRGLFMEGMEVVKTAVRQAREANVFIVFVIIDNPKNKDSILDIKVPVFKQAGQIPEIKSYMDSFPFPFYIILRDINSLPMVLSDALRQW
ncbi:midasin-like, partial [Ruditapes philippinarum]|uniref:midasin-like n=1 Tax=Ruditapes philippinarum TaxID=129788 RepID=UPI00295AD8BA